MRLISGYKASVVGILFLATMCLWGQGPQSVPVPPGHPELYFGFFALHEAISRDIETTKDSAQAISFRRGASGLFGVTEADFAVGAGVARSVMVRIGSLNAEVLAYSNAEIAAGRAPDISVLRSFQARRLTIIQAGIKELQSVVSAPGWSALQAYINGKYRSSLIHTEVTSAKR